MPLNKTQLLRGRLFFSTFTYRVQTSEAYLFGMGGNWGTEKLKNPEEKCFSLQQEPFAFVTVMCPPNSGFRTERTAARAIYRKYSSLQCGPWVKGATCGQTRNPSAGTKDQISVGETRWLSRPWAASQGKKGRCSGGGAGAPPPLPEASPCYSDGSPSAHSVVKGTGCRGWPGLGHGSTTSCLGQLGPVT